MINEIGLSRNPWEFTAIAGREIFEERPYGVWRWGRKARRWEKFRANYHRASNMEIVPEFPLQLNIGLSSACNLRCGFCIHSEEELLDIRMKWEMYRRIIDEGADNGLCSVKLNSSNEPLLRRDIAKFIKYARRKGVLNTYFATNGTIYSERLAKELIDSGLSKIMFSIDAITPGTYLRMRNSTRYYDVVKNVHSLMEEKAKSGVNHPRIRVSFLETSLNSYEKEQFLKYWSKYADSIGVQKLLNTKSKHFRSRSQGEFCSFPFKLLAIKSSGRIYQCCAFAGAGIGNIGTTGIKQAWNSEAMQKVRRAHLLGEIGRIESCAKCLGV